MPDESNAMDQGAPAAAAGVEAGVMLMELSVVLVATQNDPSVINPDFLRHTGIVDPALQVKQPAVSTPVFSQVIFEGGLSVTAEPNRFIFGQQAQPLSEDACVSPDIARRFLNVFPHIAYSALGINPKGFRPFDSEFLSSVSDALVGGGRWISFKDVLPDIQLKAIYNYESRNIVMDIGGVNIKENDGSESAGLLFQANIHRDIAENTQEKRIERLTSILSAWKNDMSDFSELITKFNPKKISP